MAVRALSSVLKTFQVLDVAGHAERPLRLADFCRATGEARAAVYQRLVTLIEAGWIEATPDGAYRLSLRAVSYASAALEQSSLGARVADALADLAAGTGETASFAVLDEGAALIVQRVESRGLLRADLKVGRRLELAVSALGRALAAHAPPELLARLAADGVELPDADIVADVRARGVAVSAVSGPRTVSAVASPVFDPRGVCVGAVSVSGPTAGFDFPAASRAAKDAAQRLSERLMGRAA